MRLSGCHCCLTSAYITMETYLYLVTRLNSRLSHTHFHRNRNRYRNRPVLCLPNTSSASELCWQKRSQKSLQWFCPLHCRTASFMRLSGCHCCLTSAYITMETYLLTGVDATSSSIRWNHSMCSRTCQPLFHCAPQRVPGPDHERLSQTLRPPRHSERLREHRQVQSARCRNRTFHFRFLTGDKCGAGQSCGLA
jgi:hypothetical protein